MISYMYLAWTPEWSGQLKDYVFSSLDDAKADLERSMNKYLDYAEDYGYFDEIEHLAIFLIQFDESGNISSKKVVEPQKINVMHRPPKDSPGWKDDEKTKHEGFEDGYWPPGLEYRCGYELVEVG